MKHDAGLALVGNALAVQVAALERARRGLRTLVVNPGGPWGGYFAGIDASGARCDAGMVLYEFTSMREPACAPSLSSYDPCARNDAGRFCRAVEAYVARHQETHALDTPQMWIDGRLLPDLLLANALEALPRLDAAPAIRAELRALVGGGARSPWHASRKDTWPLACGAEFDAVSRANHGALLHERLVAAFAAKVLGEKPPPLAPAFHRIAWLPLYWPETLLSWLDGAPQALPPTVFSAPRGEAVAALPARLAQEMRHSRLIDVREERLVHVAGTRGGYALQLERSGRLVARSLGWAQAPAQGLRAAGIATEAAGDPRVALLLVFVRVGARALRRDFSVVHAVDPGCVMYRATHTSHRSGDGPVQIVSEANAERCAALLGQADDAALTRAVLDDLARIGVLREGTAAQCASVHRLPAALPLPAPGVLARWRREREHLLDHLPGVQLLAASAGPFATTLADQIVQGLQLAERDRVALAA